MRHSITIGATWLALSAFTFSARLPSAGYDYSASTSSSLQRPQADMEQERRGAQLLVPNIFPRPSRWTDANTKIIDEHEYTWSPSTTKLPKNAETETPLPISKRSVVPTTRQSIDHTPSQLDHNGLPIQDHGPTTSPAEPPPPPHNHDAKRQGAARPAPPNLPRIEAGKEGRKKEGQKEAEGDGVQASTPPAATVEEENRKVGEVHGGCDEVYLARPIGRRGGGRTGVRWACLG
ncbi:hypothetical protein Vi05172_g7937 [Venturia inaequalis]|uniref:Uncharacterized protein n=1 Tax=Venturia inaequalis TaxID=5025 RepID=A0A8H3VPL8_VENIN|nr:hypothetical protein EG327_011032 [Venturia inaequalis]RDI82105.1 hypothetical protein Vi05172_g7937 [Venturia inaequalis]